jgi:hydroxymethylglutaryl-CoA lyase
MRALPKKVRLRECFTRDGIQREAPFITSARIIKMINSMINADFKRFEATSFTHLNLLMLFSDRMRSQRCFAGTTPWR